MTQGTCVSWRGYTPLEKGSTGVLTSRDDNSSVSILTIVYYSQDITSLYFGQVRR